MPATTSASVQLFSASAWRSSCRSCELDSLGTTRPAAAQREAAATSAANHGVPTGLTRTRIVVGPPVPSAAIAAVAVARAPSLSAGATASSRSTAATSGVNRGILAIMSARVPGMNSRLRTRVSTAMNRSLLLGAGLAPHHGGPYGHPPDLVPLVEAVVLEGDDAGARPGLGPARVDHLGHHVDGVPDEHRGRELHLGEAQVGHGGAQGQLRHGQADHQRHREHAVDQDLAELGGRRELRVQVQRLRVHGHGREQHVVGLGHRAGGRVPHLHARLELLEPHPGHGWAVDWAAPDWATACWTACRPDTSSMALVSPCGSPDSTTSRSSRRMILPVRVLGSAAVRYTEPSRAYPPSWEAISPDTSWVTWPGSAPSSRVRKATGTVPLVGSATPTTAASATCGWATAMASISRVEIRCAATLITSSARPSTHRCPSWSSTASSLVP